MKILRAFVALVLGMGIALGAGISVASATQPEFICEGYDSGKIDTVGDPATVEVSAPDGKLISGYCVKAGTEKVFIPVDPPIKTVVVDHPNKDSVSHYSLVYVDEPVEEEPEPITVRIGLTYIMDCPVDTANTWRVRNPHNEPVTVSWRNASNTLTGTHTATPGDSFFETPRGAETMIISWGGGDSGIVAGSQTKASGNDVSASDPKCTGPQPETKVEYGDWVAGEYGCDDTQVTETRSVTTTTYALVDNVWVGTPVVTEEERTRDLTAEEIDALFCPGPQPEDRVETTEWVDGVYECDDTTVTQTRTVTTTPFVLEGETWVAGTPVAVEETQTRELTQEELDGLECDLPTPPPLAYTGAEVGGIGSAAAILLSMGAILALAARRLANR